MKGKPKKGQTYSGQQELTAVNTAEEKLKESGKQNNKGKWKEAPQKNSGQYQVNCDQHCRGKPKTDRRKVK